MGYSDTVEAYRLDLGARAPRYLYHRVSPPTAFEGVGPSSKLTSISLLLREKAQLATLVVDKSAKPQRVKRSGASQQKSPLRWNLSMSHHGYKGVGDSHRR